MSSPLAALLGLLVFVLVGANCRSTNALDASNVLVVYNVASSDGAAIANHYQQVHPGSQLLGVDLSGLPNNGLDEEITADDYLATGGLREQILASLTPNVDVIVTTKDMPLRILVEQPKPSSYIDPGGVSRLVLNWEEYSSLESELTRIDTIEMWEQMGDQSWYFFAGSPPTANASFNPYYSFGIAEVGFDHETYGIRLTARLDGFSAQDVNDSIDRAQNAFIVTGAESRFHFVLDDKVSGADRMELLSQNVLSPFDQPHTYDQQDGFIQQPNVPDPSAVDVIGYVGHGVHGGAPVDYLVDPVNGIQFELADGAVFHSYESYNAVSFDPNYPATQALVAQWIARGGTAALGHVQEPGASTSDVTNEDLLFGVLLPDPGAVPGDTGLTWVESAWHATRQLSYVNTVIGDPLMRWTLALPGLQGDTNGDGIVEFNDFITVEGNWLQSGTLEDGDFTGDGIIDQADFQILQDNWLVTEGFAGVSAHVAPGEIVVLPILDPNSGWPKLSATLTRPANLDQDLDVDGDDLAIWMASYGVDDGGDVDGDGDTDGADFLLWQQQFFLYTLAADFDIDAHVGADDLKIWENSYAKNRGGDADGDGNTSGFDFLAWQREVTVPTAPITSASNSVPEPCSMLLVCAGVFVWAYPSRANRCRRPSAG